MTYTVKYTEKIIKHTHIYANFHDWYQQHKTATKYLPTRSVIIIRYTECAKKTGLLVRDTSFVIFGI